jgi:hypothetical protein
LEVVQELLFDHYQAVLAMLYLLQLQPLGLYQLIHGQMATRFLLPDFFGQVQVVAVYSCPIATRSQELLKTSPSRPSRALWTFRAEN